MLLGTPLPPPIYIYMCVCVCVCVRKYEKTKYPMNALSIYDIAQSAGAVEYTDCFSAEG